MYFIEQTCAVETISQEAILTGAVITPLGIIAGCIHVTVV